MLSESPLDAGFFLGVGGGLEFINFCKNLLNAHILQIKEKPFLRPPRHMTFYNTL